MAKIKELFNNDLNPDCPEVYDNIEEAHTASIQTAVNDLYTKTHDDKNYVIDVDSETDLDAIETACRNFLKAVKGKFVYKYLLEDSE